MISENHLYLLENGLPVDGLTKQDLSRELLAARALIEAMRNRRDTECEFGIGCKLPEDEDSECDWCVIRRLFTAYDAATKGNG